jgi:hypothetical protein
MAFAAFRENRRVFFVVSLLIAVPGLFLGPAIMTPAYRILQPALGGMTLLVAEMLFALIIDFPLAMIASAVICRVSRAQGPADGALAGAFFLVVFGILIVACIPLQPLSGIIGSLALQDVLPLALSSAREELGAPALGGMMALFALSDFTLCALGGVAGYYYATLFARDGRRQIGRPEVRG